MSIEFLSFFLFISFIGGRGWAPIRGWALINFFHFLDGHLFKIGTNSGLGAKSNKYGVSDIK